MATLDEKTPLAHETKLEVRDEKSEPQSKTRRPVARFLGVVFPILLVVVGISWFLFVEDFDAIDSFYVYTQIITTVGYGDLSIDKRKTQIFLSFYILTALVVVAYYVNYIVSIFMSGESTIICKYLRKLEDAVDDEIDSEEGAKRKYGDLNQVIVSLSMFLVTLIGGLVFYRLYEHCTCGRHSEHVSGCEDNHGFERCKATGGHVKTWASTLYMCVVTLTTVGFGDFGPQTAVGRSVGVVWMLIGVAACANFIAALSNYFYESEKHEAYDEVDVLSSVDRKNFDQIDRNGNGSLSSGEYLAYALVKYTGIEKECIDEIMKEYARIDTHKTNAVTFEMLKERQKEISEKKRRRESKQQRTTFVF